MPVTGARGEAPHNALPTPQVAIISGSTAGIGFATARALANRGVSVVLNGRDSARLRDAVADLESEAPHCEVRGVVGDAADETTVAAMVRAGEAMGALSISVANAGGGIGGRTWDDVDEGSLWESLRANVVATALLIRQAGVPMKRLGYGRIVTVASLAGRRTSPTAGPDYACAKAAVVGLTRSAAQDLAPFGVTVNCVAPGVTMTARIRRRVDDLPSQKRRDLLAGIPLGRWGQPEEAAAAIAFLASAEAGFITGATLDVNGGACMG